MRRILGIALAVGFVMALSYSASWGITIQITPEGKPGFEIDGLSPSADSPPPLRDYIYNGAFPSSENDSGNDYIERIYRVYIPGATELHVFSLLAEDPSDENLICAISTFVQTAEQPVWDNFGSTPNGSEITNIITGSGEALWLVMFVGDNGDYTFWGPVAINQPSPCDFRPGPYIPSLAQYGLVALAALLVVSGGWALSRRRKRSC